MHAGQGAFAVQFEIQGERTNAERLAMRIHVSAFKAGRRKLVNQACGVRVGKTPASDFKGGNFRPGNGMGRRARISADCVNFWSRNGGCGGAILPDAVHPL
jgi:hypothetical protein